MLRRSGSCPFVCCVNVCLHCRFLRSSMDPFYVGTIVRILFLMMFSFSTSGVNGVKRVDYTDGISTDGALQLHQVISPCERCCWLSCIPTTPGHLVQDGPEGKDAREHSSTPFHSPAREDSHYMQVIAACDLHAFLSVQQMLTSLYRVQESDVFH